MKRTGIAVMLAVLCGAPAGAEAPPPSEFAYCAGIGGATEEGALYRVPLGEDLLRNARPGLDDLRVFDGEDREVPYAVIENAPPHQTVETYPLEIAGYDREAAAAVVVLKLPEKHRPISVIDLDIADRDFKKRVVLSESSDGRSWSPLAKGNIFDFSSQVDVRRTRIEFPETGSRYFRIALADLGQPAEGQTNIRLRYEGLDFTVNGMQKKELRIRSVRGSTGNPAERHPVYDQHVVPSVTAKTDKDGNTIVLLPGGLPINRLSFAVDNPYYSRTVQLLGSDTGAEDSYRLLASDVLYRFPLSSEHREERNVMFPCVPKQAFYKIVVLNRNNPPLRISGLTLSWVQQNLYFIALRTGDRYRLCYGNNRVRRPDYDIVNFVNRNTLSQHAFRTLEAGPARPGTGPRVTLADRVAGMEKPVLRTVVVLLVIGMGIWLYRLMKRSGGKQ